MGRSFSLTNLLSIPRWRIGIVGLRQPGFLFGRYHGEFSKTTHLIGRKDEVQFVERELIKTEEANVILVGTRGGKAHDN